MEPEWLVMWLTIAAIMIAIGAYVLSKIRADTLQSEPDPSELLTKFRDWHSEGELTDEEFRTIKTTLAAQLQQELKDREKAG